MKVLRIKNWNAFFENATTKRIKILPYVLLPVKKGFGRLKLQQDKSRAGAIYGAWCAIVQEAASGRYVEDDPRIRESKGLPKEITFEEISRGARGYLFRNGRAMDASDLAMMEDIPERDFAEAIPKLLSKDVGWLEEVEIDPNGFVHSQNQSPQQALTLSFPGIDPEAPTPSKTTKEHIVKDDPDDPIVMKFPVIRKDDGPNEWGLRKSLKDRLAKTYPAVNVDAELEKSLTWLITNPQRMKTASGMPKYLNGWMERKQNDGGSRIQVQQINRIKQVEESRRAQNTVCEY